MQLQISYEEYLNRILGGWIGKSIGGTVGARFEGYKGWIEVEPKDMFPDEIPPNDDLDLQVLWLKVLEEKGAALDSDDLARAWLEGCWYPFNEYGIFRRNWKLGIHPPYSGRFTNAFWETGMGCPIRSEIWSYVFPGAPDLAAQYAEYDGTLDHTAQSVGAEKMFAAMGAMAFFVPDVRRLTEMFIHHLPENTTIQRLTVAAIDAYDRGLSLRDARDLLLTLEGHPEACDAPLNVPFTLLALLYGDNDLQETELAALRCGYDTDCTLATAGALLGQIMGADAIPADLKAPIGDQLVMGIEYHRDEMTLSALARDTARIGALFCQDGVNTAVQIIGAPTLEPLPVVIPAPKLWVAYQGLPSAAPGETVHVTVHVDGELDAAGETLNIVAPEGWTAMPASFAVRPVKRTQDVALHCAADTRVLPLKNLFTMRLGTRSEESFGIAGAALYKFLGVYFDPTPPQGDDAARRRAFNHHFVDVNKQYLPEAAVDVEGLYARWSNMLGRPAVIVAKEREVAVEQISKLKGAYVAYLARTIVSPSERDVFLVMGNTDAIRLYLNGELVADIDEQVWWTPSNLRIRAHLREGENEMLLVLVKRGETLRFSLGFRDVYAQKTDSERVEASYNLNDWYVDLGDVNPEG